MKKEVFNPYLPLHEYIPDGEPHIFGDRVYIYGSHDKENGEFFCLLDYVCYSAPITDLSDWRYEGVIYKKTDDPMNKDGKYALFAPDVCQGPDGRYYLFYSLEFLNLIAVAVCDTPAGKYEFHGMIQYPNGELLKENVPYDPAVIHDNGKIYLYYGFAPTFMEIPKFPKDLHMPGCSMVELEKDMLTIKTGPVEVLPSTLYSKGTGFEGHEYFEAPSIRKINDLYYHVYSSALLHELCYATSQYSDKNFVYRGTVISNGDVGLNGRKEQDKLMVTANNHGGLVCANGQWYIFYHRHTHAHQFSRQGCAEPITLKEDGSIDQVEITSCGLNTKPLSGKGEYPAIICCNLTNGKMPELKRNGSKEGFPYITNQGEERFITAIDDGVLVGYKYFDFSDTKSLSIMYRGDGNGQLNVDVGSGESCILKMDITPSDSWREVSKSVIFPQGVHPLFLKYQGNGSIEFISFKLN